MLECNNRFEDRAFLLLLAGVSLAFLWMLRPFFDVIFWGIVIALLSTPVYDALQRRSMGRNLAALTCVILRAWCSSSCPARTFFIRSSTRWPISTAA